MTRPLVFPVALALALLAVGAFGTASSAQPQPTETYPACGNDRAVIQAEQLPRLVQPERCPFNGRPIVDHGVGSDVPGPGEGVYAEGYGPAGSQELLVSHRRDGVIALDFVGDDTAQLAGGTLGGGSPCTDEARNRHGWRLERLRHWRLNKDSIPGYLVVDNVETAVREGGTNIITSHNNCGLADNAPNAYLQYEGNTPDGVGVDINTDATCQNSSDGYSVVGFGGLPGNFLGRTCVWGFGETGFDEVSQGDIRLNQDDFRWTTHGEDNSCWDGVNNWDIESTMTHERGHHFGIAHVDEEYHGSLTMSERSDGPCQTSERTLGRGDVISLNIVYQANN